MFDLFRELHQKEKEIFITSAIQTFGIFLFIRKDCESRRIVSQRELINLACFLSLKKLKIKMIISIFRGSKGEDLQVFSREYKKTYIGIGLKIIVKWFNFYHELLKGKTSH